MPHGSPILLPFERERMVPSRTSQTCDSEESFHERILRRAPLLRMGPKLYNKKGIIHDCIMAGDE